MNHTSYIELNRTALQKNIRYLKKRIKPDVKFVSVIKGNAYGHGIECFVPLAEACSIDYFAVYDAFEAYRAHEVMKPDTQLMIMGMIEGEDIRWAINRSISFFVFDLHRLKETIKYAKDVQNPAHIHLEVETGLNRTGLEDEELFEAIELINAHPDEIVVDGVCTHFAGAESIANYYRIQQQIKCFKSIKEELLLQGITPKYYHTACSAAALNYPETQMNMVRFGIAQYGFWPNTETKMYNLLSDDTTFTHDPLRSILSWKSKVMSIKKIDPGKFVGYGHFFQATKPTTIASIPVGYYHGYRRNLSNIGYVLIKGKKAPVIGLVNMSMMIVNITGIHDVKPGDEVVLIGGQGKQRISVASFTEMSSLINYELLVRLPQQIPRVVTL